ncbi:MAG: AAA family ATPase [Candidatus Aenigmarchaeota archaeon]|nr:AAA family ATPase [Candidatus Aenigmarchaeota archaeon]
MKRIVKASRGPWKRSVKIVTVGKKNTLLYMDSDLVRKAKKEGLNMSEIAEQAIRSQLNIKTGFDPSEYLNDRWAEDTARFIPMRIKGIELTNIGPIRKARLEFHDLNIIVGGNATGKTTILTSINYAFNDARFKNMIINESAETGEIRLELPERTKFFNFKFEKDKNTYRKCLLLDDAFARLDPERSQKFLDYLKKDVNLQVIMTCTKLPEIDMKAVNVIRL